MLMKLMKHELKVTARTLIPLYIVLLVISIINRINLQVGIKDVTLFNLLTGLLTAAQHMLIIAILITTTIFLIIRFYKNLLTDEGYLMFTLPVKTHQLITSKLITTLVWLFISSLVILLSLFILFGSLSSITVIFDQVQRFFTEITAYWGGQWGILLLEMILLALLVIVANILLIYTSIAIGQLFNKHKIIASFAAYAILFNLLQFLGVAVLVNLRFTITNNESFVNLMLGTIFPLGIFFGLVICIIFYTATNYIFTKKLNLE